MRKKRYLFIAILFFISIGFAILSSNLSIGSNMAISSASFNVHLENASVYQTNINNYSNPTINAAGDTLTLNVALDKPNDYITVTFMVVNSGTIDAQLNEIVSTTLTTEERTYIDFSYNYYDGSSLTVGDMLRAGQKKLITMTYKYKYNISDLINITSKDISISLKYIQPNSYDDTVWVYDYAGSAQTFKAPHTGNYKIELWGASGGVYYSIGRSYGGYTSGTINLTKGDTLYVYVGAKGKGFNYGTQTYHNDSGGATDVRLIGGTWSNFDSLKSRIMVASAGGGSGGTNAWDTGDPYGGAAGGLVGYKGGDFYSYGTTFREGPSGATQTTGSFFGNTTYVSSWTPGGGGGYFVGFAISSTGISGVYSTGGGSSYISGHIGCVAIDGSSTSNNITFPTKHGVVCDDGTVDVDCSIHSSGKYFTNTVMIDGLGYEWQYHNGDTEVTASTEAVGMPAKTGTGTMTGNSGDGYAKITYMG